MSLKITRDDTGIVTITDTSTGRSERIATRVSNRPTAALVADADKLPSHHWVVMPSPGGAQD